MSSASLSRPGLAAGLVCGIGVAGLALAPAAAAEPGLPAPTLADATVVLGDAIVLSGTGCFAPEGAVWPADVYYVGPSSWFEGWTQAEPDGTWTMEIAYHVDAQPGTYELEVNCDYYTEDGAYPPVTLTLLAEESAPEISEPRTTPETPKHLPTRTIRGAEANTPGVGSPDTGATTGDRAHKKVVKVLTGFKPFEKVTVTLHSTPTTVGTYTADASGTVAVEFDVPSGTAAGAHTLVYEGDQGTYFQEALTVEPDTTSTSQALAYTGASIALPLGLGAGALAVGTGLVLLSRRRTAEAPQA